MGRLRATHSGFNPTVKPQFGSVEIDRGHPLAQGLLFGFLANEGAGKCRDILERLTPSTRGSVVNPTWDQSLGGLGHSATRQWYNTSATYTSPDSASCLLVAVDVLNTGMVPVAILGVWDGLDVDQKNWRLEMDDSSLVLNGFVLQYQGGRSQFSFNIRQAGLHTYGFVMDNAVDTGRFYRDGRFVENAPTEAGSFLTTGSNAYPILGAPPTATGIRQVASFVWDHALSSDMMAWATAEPYAFLCPIVRRRYFILTQAAPPVSGNTFIQEHVGRGIGRGVFAGR